jgi:hypothetical protein
LPINVSHDDHGHVILQHANWACDPSRATGLVMSEEDWTDLRLQAVRYELAHGCLRHIPLDIPLSDTLGDRLI